jgi:hypothetical protein
MSLDRLSPTRIPDSAGCPFRRIALEGPIALITTPSGFEVRSSTSGQILSTIDATAASNWALATDGSYLTAVGNQGLFAWSPSGALMLSRPPG